MEFYSEYVTGYRMWRVQMWTTRMWQGQRDEIVYPGLISSIYSDFAWPYKKPATAHGWVTLGGSAGLYAYKNTAEGRRYVQRNAWIEPNAVVIGTVALWGHVAVHELGYRAQYGYPLELELLAPGMRLREQRQLAKDLTALYGVPVRCTAAVREHRLETVVLLTAGFSTVLILGLIVFVTFLVLTSLSKG